MWRNVAHDWSDRALYSAKHSAKHSSCDGFQLVVMMEAAETGVGNDTKSGW